MEWKSRMTIPVTASADSGEQDVDVPLHWRQIVAIAVCVLLNALDGFDVLSISFASPGIAKEWNIDGAALGVVLSMELVGMAIGAILLGRTADRWGRRPTALVCLVVMASGMFATSHVETIGTLAATRLFTGLGIGGMLACTNAMAAEYANERWRGAAVAVMAAGYPIGAILGGSIATEILKNEDWRGIFHFGAVVSALFIPILLLFAPETANFITRRGQADAQTRSIADQRNAPALPNAVDAQETFPWSTLFASSLRKTTALLTVAYFFHVMTFYFLLKWVPKIVSDMGFAAVSASGVLVWANVGGLGGSLLFSAMALRVPLRHLLIGSMVGSAVLVTLFGQAKAELGVLSWAAAAACFFGNAGMVGLYALVAASFPAEMRAGGTGFVIGLGRGGAALAPIVAGYLFTSKLGLPLVAFTMATGSIIAAVAVLSLPGSRRFRQERW